MDNKVYNLLEIIHTEVENIKSKMATKEDLTGMATKEDFHELNQRIVLLEDKMDKNHKALYDGQQLMYDKLITLETKVNRIEQKVEKHDVEIRVIKASAN